MGCWRGYSKRSISWCFKAILPPQARIERDLQLEHYGLGVVVHPNVVIGKRVRIYHHVTLASETWIGSEHKIVIGDDVVIGAGAIVIARTNTSLTIGQGARVGAGAVVTRDVGPGRDRDRRTRASRWLTTLMRILFLADAVFEDKPGGSRVVARELARGLVGRGHEVTFLVARHGPEAPGDERSEGVRIVRYTGAGRAGAFVRTGGRAAARLWAEGAFDVAHTHFAYAALGPLVALPRGLPHVRSFYGPWDAEDGWKTLAGGLILSGDSGPPPREVAGVQWRPRTCGAARRSSF